MLEKQLQACLSIANERDLWQNAFIGMRQMTDITLRALSPGINDPTTAVLDRALIEDQLKLTLQQMAE